METKRKVFKLLTMLLIAIFMSLGGFVSADGDETRGEGWTGEEGHCEDIFSEFEGTSVEELNEDDRGPSICPSNCPDGAEIKSYAFTEGDYYGDCTLFYDDTEAEEKRVLHLNYHDDKVPEVPRSGDDDTPQCGEEDGKVYDYDEDNWDTNNFCSVGVLSGDTSFPGQGETTSWICAEGDDEVSCSAERSEVENNEGPTVEEKTVTLDELAESVGGEIEGDIGEDIGDIEMLHYEYENYEGIIDMTCYQEHEGQTIRDNYDMIKLTVNGSSTATSCNSSYELLVEIQGQGDVIVGDAAAEHGQRFEYDPGQEVYLQVEPAEEYEFVGWYGDISGDDESFDLTMDSSMGIGAEFVHEDDVGDTEEEFEGEFAGEVDGGKEFENRVGIEIEGGGQVKVEDSEGEEIESFTNRSGILDLGTGQQEIELKATAVDGYSFVGWHGAVLEENGVNDTTSEEIEITVGYNASITAQFVTDEDYEEGNYEEPVQLDNVPSTKDEAKDMIIDKINEIDGLLEEKDLDEEDVNKILNGEVDELDLSEEELDTIKDMAKEVEMLNNFLGGEEINFEKVRTNMPEIEGEVGGSGYSIKVNSYTEHDCGRIGAGSESTWSDCVVTGDWDENGQIECIQSLENVSQVYAIGGEKDINEIIVYDGDEEIARGGEEGQCNHDGEEVAEAHFDETTRTILIDTQEPNLLSNNCYGEQNNPFYPNTDEQDECSYTIGIQVEELAGDGTSVVGLAGKEVKNITANSPKIEDLLNQYEEDGLGYSYEEYQQAMDDAGLLMTYTEDNFEGICDDLQDAQSQYGDVGMITHKDEDGDESVYNDIESLACSDDILEITNDGENHVISEQYMQDSELRISFVQDEVLNYALVGDKKITRNGEDYIIPIQDVMAWVPYYTTGGNVMFDIEGEEGFTSLSLDSIGYDFGNLGGNNSECPYSDDIATIYENLFDRCPDDAGYDHRTNYFEENDITSMACKYKAVEQGVSGGENADKETCLENNNYGWECPINDCEAFYDNFGYYPPSPYCDGDGEYSPYAEDCTTDNNQGDDNSCKSLDSGENNRGDFDLPSGNHGDDYIHAPDGYIGDDANGEIGEFHFVCDDGDWELDDTVYNQCREDLELVDGDCVDAKQGPSIDSVVDIDHTDSDVFGDHDGSFNSYHRVKLSLDNTSGCMLEAIEPASPTFDGFRKEMGINATTVQLDSDKDYIDLALQSIDMLTIQLECDGTVYDKDVLGSE